MSMRDITHDKNRRPSDDVRVESDDGRTRFIDESMGDGAWVEIDSQSVLSFA